jgi:transcriptional regulator with XRE-family HTH domain
LNSISSGRVDRKRRINNMSNQIGEKVRFFRLQRGMSQQQLAEGICSTASVSHLETGRGGISVGLLSKLADKLMVPLNEIYRDFEDEYPYSVKLELAEAYILRNECESAQELLNYLAEREDLTILESQRWVLLQGMLCNNSSRAGEAVEVLQPLLDDIEKEHSADDEMTCQLYTQLGNAYYQLRDFTKAYSSYKRAYQVALRLPIYEITSAIATYNMGMICNELGLGNEAIIYLDQARAYFDSISDLQKMAQVYFSFAIATGNETYVHRALQLYQELNALKMVNLVRQYHAYHIQAKNDYKSAVQELHDVALKMDELEEKGDSIYTLAKAVLVCVEHGDIEQAIYYLSLASEYKENANIQEPYDLVLYYRAKAKVHLSLGEYNVCIDEARKSSEMYDTLGKYMDSADSLEIMVEAYQQLGMHKAACEIFKEITERLRRSQGGNQL